MVRAFLLAVGIALAICLGPAAFAQTAPGRSHHKKQLPPPPVITEASPEPAPPPAPPPVLTPEQMPPRPPEVVWDGKLLSINAENSTLSDILVAVRARTGAEIDVPPGSARERMAARLGPGPVREVLTSLLSGTDYDYIIQASETNEDGIQSVILTPRGKGEDLIASSSTPSTPGIRRGPGYTASGKHTFEVVPDTANESAASQDVASTGEGEQTGQPAGASGAEAAAANMQPSSADPQPQSDSSSKPASSVASSDPPPISPHTLPGVDMNGDQPPTVEQRVQGMQQMFEQRRQIQAQQNQAQQNHAASPAN